MTFNCILFTGNDSLGNKGFITYRKVHKLEKFILFINRKFPDWLFFNVFDNRDKKFLKCIKNEIKMKHTPPKETFINQLSIPL